MTELYRVAQQLLTAYRVDRDALFSACTVGGDHATLDADDRACIEVMDELIDRATAAIRAAGEVLDVER